MQSKHKVRLLRANLLAAAVVLALWTPAAPPVAALILWLSVGWLFATALLLTTGYRRSAGLPWQLLPGLLLVGLIAAAPQRHALLIWAWCGLFMLPQARWITAFNISGTLLSAVLLAPHLNLPALATLLVTLSLLSLVSRSRARQFSVIHSTLRQRQRLIPGTNLQAPEQLPDDVRCEQVRCRRDDLHGELLLLTLERRQRRPFALALCRLTYRFESVYRLNATTLAVMLLSRSAREAEQRRTRLLGALPARVESRRVPLAALDPARLDPGAIDVKTLDPATRQPHGARRSGLEEAS